MCRKKIWYAFVVRIPSFGAHAVIARIRESSHQLHHQRQTRDCTTLKFLELIRKWLTVISCSFDFQVGSVLVDLVKDKKLSRLIEAFTGVANKKFDSFEG